MVSHCPLVDVQLFTWSADMGQHVGLYRALLGHSALGVQVDTTIYFLLTVLARSCSRICSEIVTGIFVHNGSI